MNQLKRLSTVVAVVSAAIAGTGVAAATAHQPSGYGPPAIKPANFVRHVDNPYFPLTPGTTFTYTGVKDGKAARDVVVVSNRTDSIMGVAATVVHDRLYLQGALAEDTIDWYAQDKRGDVVYLGESTRALDAHGHLTDTEGSWKTGVNGARPGIFMPAHPRLGQVFRQEYYKGHAEDHFQVVDFHAHVHVPAVSSNQALKTREWTPLEPDVLSNKYYVRGIGDVREVDIHGSNEHLELVSVHRAR